MKTEASTLLKRIWERLSDRKKAPRCWWYPITGIRLLPHDVLTEAYKQYGETTNRTMVSLLAVGTFCLLTVIGTPDKALLAAQGTVKVPFAEASISFLAFVIVAPLLIIVITAYLHIFYGYWMDLERERRQYNLRPSDREKGPVERLAMLFALEDPVSRGLTALIFYWLTPCVLAVTAWKAAGRSEFNLPLFQVLCVVTAGMIFLSIRRCPEASRKLMNRPRWFVLAGIGVLLAAMPWHQDSLRRPMNLFREDLTEAWLVGVDLRGANLERAKLKGAALAGASLQNANLLEANLEGANLMASDARGAVFLNANLQRAHLGFADLRGAVLTFADLREARLPFVNLENADLSMAKLQRTILSGTFDDDLSRTVGIGPLIVHLDLDDFRRNKPITRVRPQDLVRVGTIVNAALRGTNLQGADLRRADLWQAELQRANLQGANLQKANLEGANLQGANLEKANLRDARLQGANLRGVDLANVRNLTKEQIASAMMDEKTRLPDYLKAQQKGRP